MNKILFSAVSLGLIGTLLVGCSNNASDSTGSSTSTISSTSQTGQSDVDKALALINTFATGDTDLATSLLASNYKQHNLTVADGAEGFINAVEGLKAANVPVTVRNVRSFEDGKYVVLQNVYNFGAGDQVAFDIFRFDDAGKIAEHWDNLTDLASQPNPSGHTQIDGPTTVSDLDKTEVNRELVKNFLFDVMQGNNPQKMPEYFDGDNYIQHNTAIADGVSGLTAALGAMAEQGIEMKYNSVHMVLAQGDFVLAVSEGTLGNEPTAYYDLWRVENGKIAEHWDVVQAIPDSATWQNQNGKF
ncbi:MAG: nuclear transport factor 2 family protein [Corynebacterium sp.]|nr:nuclear transport factor 2 family protein [Corynebacterium sp.]